VNLKCDILVSKSAIKLSLYRYNEGNTATKGGAVAMTGGVFRAVGTAMTSNTAVELALFTSRYFAVQTRFN
jgi:hypothetical protein